jgi:pimeloyl-ACP methyl ester carboxylesterase
MTSGTLPAPDLHYVDAKAMRLAFWEWRAPLRGRVPTLLMVHATGFHGRVWDQVIQRLPEWHVIALELRGHGRSDKTEITGWEPFGRDIASAVAALDLSNLVGIGHSMGAHGLVQGAAFESARFRSLFLVDPVIASPQAYHAAPMFPPGTMHPAARRRAGFDSVADMIERFSARMPYSLFQADALRDYCEWGTLTAPVGPGRVLACSPITEASVYMTGRNNASVYASIRALQIPVQVVRAKQRTPDSDPFDYSYSPTWPEVAGEFRHGRDLLIADRSHFLPMEDPDLTASLIREFVETR